MKGQDSFVCFLTGVEDLEPSSLRLAGPRPSKSLGSPGAPLGSLEPFTPGESLPTTTSGWGRLPSHEPLLGFAPLERELTTALQRHLPSHVFGLLLLTTPLL